jgi:exodeoxyribonuclease VII small subunit
MEQEKYTESVKRLEQIIEQIENGELNVDQLSEKVKEASKLIQFCRQKLFNTEKEVEDILQKMEGEHIKK